MSFPVSGNRIALLAAALVWTAPGVALACLPALKPTVEEERFSQALAWDSADAVFVVRLVQTGPARANTRGPTPDVPFDPDPELEMVVVPGQVLKNDGSIVPSSMEVAVRPNCVASDIERGAVGDLFLAYVSNGGNSTRPGFIALSRIVEPRTLEALASAMHD